MKQHELKSKYLSDVKPSRRLDIFRKMRHQELEQGSICRILPERDD